jgi:lipopolysaccharide biosynthesis glycosyltransferase
MDIIYINDDYFFVQLAVSIYSLFQSNPDIQWTVHFIDTGMSAEHLEYIKGLCDRYNHKIIVYDSNVIVGKINDMGITVPTDGNNISTLIRLFMYEIIPDDIDKAIYLDTDTLVTGSFNELKNLDFTECISAVKDANYDFYINRLKSIGVSTYFNAGFMFINLKKMRAKLHNVDMFNFISNNYLFADQDILNIIFCDDIRVLPPKYNSTSRYRVVRPNNIRKWIGSDAEIYSIEDLREAKNNPVVIHFTTSLLGRGWEVNSYDPEQKLWMDVFEKLNLSRELLVKRRLSTTTKVGRFLYRTIPQGFFVRIDYVYALKKYEKINTLKEG